MSGTTKGATPALAEGASAGPLAVGGALSALGALSVVITSAFYAMSPPAAAGPQQPLDLAAAMAGAAGGARTLHIAGTVGIFGDVIWATAALIIAAELGRRGRGVAAAGWSALLVSIMLFTFIDGMTGYVLPPLAAAGNPSFEGFKRLWDVLFLLGTATYGGGVVAALGGEASSRTPMVSRALSLLLTFIGLIAAAASIAGFADVTAVPTDKIAGGMIGLGSLLLVPASLQIARA
jgi:hypothetical protein